MPDYVSLGWLQRRNLQNAEFVMGKALQEGSVDISLLNSMLQVKASLGSLGEASRFHEEEFRKHELVRMSAY